MARPRCYSAKKSSQLLHLTLLISQGVSFLRVAIDCSSLRRHYFTTFQRRLDGDEVIVSDHCRIHQPLVQVPENAHVVNPCQSRSLFTFAGPRTSLISTISDVPSTSYLQMPSESHPPT